MRALIQRVSEASVEVHGARVAGIAGGLLVLVGVGHADGLDQASWMAAKIARLRVFADAEGKMNRSLADVGGAALVVSQFTLYGDVSRGNRPSFAGAAQPDQGAALVEQTAAELERLGIPVGRGRFGAHMRVALVNDGPVTIWLETP